jgi:hypothetical protein
MSHDNAENYTSNLSLKSSIKGGNKQQLKQRAENFETKILPQTKNTNDNKARAETIKYMLNAGVFNETAPMEKIKLYDTYMLH